jgi:mono/diheme cytochrome c family protein
LRGGRSLAPRSAARGPRWTFALIAIAAVALSACGGNHRDQLRYDPLQESQFFEDKVSARPLVEDTIARGKLQNDPHLYTGRDGGGQTGEAAADAPLVKSFPFPVTRPVLERGQKMYIANCAPCHSPVGDGQGMIVRRGFQPPPSLHIQRLRDVEVGHYYDVITNGYGAMASYADQVEPRDRWAITAYIRALQLSQNASLSDVPEEERSKLDQPQPTPGPAHGGGGE